MLTLLLFRHAKSDWSTEGLDDHERPLARRGAKAAPLMARHIDKQQLKPDLVLCSDSVRTRATLALLLPELGGQPPDVTLERRLYLADAETILDVIRAQARAGDKRVMVIGHNPGLHALALTLVGDGDKKAMKKLAMKFPTAALAVIEFDTDGWQEVAPAKGRLEALVIPRDL
jgi:phosphohistidine phosphatase